MAERLPPILAFVDIETSGDKPVQHELLEAACVLVDPITGETLGEPGLDDVSVAVEPSDDRWVRRMPKVVAEMHERSGLLDQLEEGMAVSRQVADRMLYDWIRRRYMDHVEAYPERGQVRPVWLAGAGVSHFESRWLPVVLPDVAELTMTYEAGCRVIDTSATRRHLELAGVTCPDFTTAKPHRALPDVWLHVAEYRWQRALFRRVSLAPDVVEAIPVWLPFDVEEDPRA